MPFVSLGSRKRLEVVLDEDKQRIAADMQAKDNFTTMHHFGHAPGRSGYLYANHPLTKGPVRGPPAPFMKANKPWAPEEHHPSGPHAQKNNEQAPIGAYTDGSHASVAETLRKSRSLPALERTLASSPKAEDGKSLGERAKEAANPVSIELNRWKRLANVTNRDLGSMPELHSWIKPDRPKPKVFVPSGGLVNFPKYMLFENSHMKQMDLQRFNVDQQKIQEAAERGEEKTPPFSPSQDTEEGESNYRLASWGQPKHREAQGKNNKLFAGSAMPAGRCQRSSNPFRMG
jgi:hypothetical protein